MKKHLLIAVLILAVITSLTAGTLAQYNLTLAKTGDEAVTPLHFNFSAKCSQQLLATVKLNPGKSQLYAVTITNSSEMPIKFLADASVTSMTEGFANVFNTSWFEDTAMSTPLARPFEIGTGISGAKTVYVKLTWVNQVNATDVGFGQMQPAPKAALKVSINGSYTDNNTGAPSMPAPIDLVKE